MLQDISIVEQLKNKKTRTFIVGNGRETTGLLHLLLGVTIQNVPQAWSKLVHDLQIIL